MYNLGLVGNCQVAALVSRDGSIPWLCMPRPDSEPVFGSLLDDDGGVFQVIVDDAKDFQQSYVGHSAILENLITDSHGATVKMTDFCPRFEQFGRMFRPPAFVRIIEPTYGASRIRIHCKPVDGWKKTPLHANRGSSHLRFDFGNGRLFIHTNMPLTFLLEETPFLLQEPIYFTIQWDSSLEGDIHRICEEWRERTYNYWRTWTKRCSIPPHYQNEVLRSAVTLKLHCYEDTGAILASVATSLPEEVGQVRNWDYRYCWLRDSYYTLAAFRKLGHYEECEGFLKFLSNVAHQSEFLSPVYTIDQKLPVPEIEHQNWRGFLGTQPVRSGNLAALQVQNDAYGETILALAPLFLDERFEHLRTSEAVDNLIWLAKKCIEHLDKPDAGLWEFRGLSRVHSFTNLMCWAGLDRFLRIASVEKSIAKKISLKPFEQACEQAIVAVQKGVRDGSLRANTEGEDFDASVLQLASLGFPNNDLVKKTVQDIWQNLVIQSDPTRSYMLRYKHFDDFGAPQGSFLVCSFWLCQALFLTGQHDQAKSVFDTIMKSGNHLGLFSEHFLPSKAMQLGNFPQTYSHVGLINAAFLISPNWESVL